MRDGGRTMRKKQDSRKLWMVEQRWRFKAGMPPMPVRSVLKAKSRKAAAAGAAASVKRAVSVLAGRVVGRPVGPPVVLYALGPAALMEGE